MRRLLPLLIPAAIVAHGCARPAASPGEGAPATPAAAAGAAGAAPRPTLVVLITVDQMRADYVPRWESQLTGGLARLWRGGAAMTEGVHDHANTETAPGHASTLSGRHPRSTGIVRNSAGVLDPRHPLVGSDAAPASPFRFRGTTLFDWMKARDPRARALSVSRKDRGAILPIGRDSTQQVYWYGYDGRMTTSTWYADTLPAWVRRFNDRRIPRSYAGKAWTLLLPDSAYAEPDSVRVESGGSGFTFPHVAPTAPDSVERFFPEFPWMDQLTLDMALAGLEELKLGAGPATDLLAISLSTTDAIGHRYGPDSREIHDQILRLDRMLGAFLDSLYRLRDSTRVIVALTADHGVTPYPELRVARGERALKVDLRPATRAFLDSAAARGVAEGELAIDDAVLFLDRAALRKRRLNPDSIADAYAAAMRAVPGVARADRMRDLARADTVHDFIARRWLHMLPPDLGAEVVVTLEPYAVPAPASYAQHGSPYDYDARVPIVFYGAPFRAGHYGGPARVVDIAPTLARVLGVRPLERVEGVVLERVLK